MIQTFCDVCDSVISEPYPREVQIVQNGGVVRLGHLCDVHAAQLKFWLHQQMVMMPLGDPLP